MSYTPTNWQCGDTISAEKLNNIEEGIEEALASSGNEPLDVNMTYDSSAELYTLDTSSSDIWDAYTSDRRVLVHYVSGSIVALGELVFAKVEPSCGVNYHQFGIVWDANFWQEEGTIPIWRFASSNNLYATHYEPSN